MRILLVQTAYLGDIVLTTPLLRELRRVHPEAVVCVLTTETGRQTLDGQPGIDRVLVLDKRWNSRGVSSYAGVVRELVRARFDAAIAAHRSVRTGVILVLSGAGLRVGFGAAPGSWAYNVRVPWEPTRHAARRYLDLAAAVGGDPEGADPRPRLRILPETARRVNAFLRARGVGTDEPLVCIAPGSVWPTKRWVAAGYGQVVAAVRERGLRAVIVGAAVERELCKEVADLSRGEATVLAGDTAIPELAALCGRAAALVGNDSGPAHVAAAVGTPVVSVFGSTTPAQGYVAFGFRHLAVEHPGLACRPCGRHGREACPFGHLRCMTEVPAEVVVDRLDEVLAGSTLRRSAGTRGQVLPTVAPG